MCSSFELGELAINKQGWYFAIRCVKHLRDKKVETIVLFSYIPIFYLFVYTLTIPFLGIFFMIICKVSSRLVGNREGQFRRKNFEQEQLIYIVTSAPSMIHG
jgi:hypothetical protein